VRRDGRSQKVLDRALDSIGREIGRGVRRTPKTGDTVVDRRGTEYVIWRDGSLRRKDLLAAAAAKEG